MNEDEEEYDELPPITVNSTARDARSFLMPCASEVAAQRARAEYCELELRRMRALEPALPSAPAPPACLLPAPRSDSSGSEGEAALAAAVTALRVRTAPPPERGPRLPALVAAVAARMRPPAPAFLAAYSRAAARAPGDAARAALDDRVLESICAALGGGTRPWEADAAAAAGAWLCCALAAREGARLGVRLPRAAHHLLDELAPAAASRELARVLPRAVRGARARLDLSDALRSGGARAEAIADALCACASEREESEPYVSLQLAGRLRAHAQGAERADAERADVERADAALAAAVLAAAPPARDTRPDALKVLVAASKLRVLFHLKK